MHSRPRTHGQLSPVLVVPSALLRIPSTTPQSNNALTALDLSALQTIESYLSFGVRLTLMPATAINNQSRIHM